jgi:hypothetical protein
MSGKLPPAGDADDETKLLSWFENALESAVPPGERNSHGVDYQLVRQHPFPGSVMIEKSFEASPPGFPRSNHPWRTPCSHWRSMGLSLGLHRVEPRAALARLLGARSFGPAEIEIPVNRWGSSRCERSEFPFASRWEIRHAHGWFPPFRFSRIQPDRAKLSETPVKFPKNGNLGWRPLLHALPPPPLAA